MGENYMVLSAIDYKSR